MPKADHSIFESLGEMLKQPPPPSAVYNPTWHPRLNPTQKVLFDSSKRFILAHGEKGGAKTYGCLSKLVRHCYENDNALALILVRVRSMANKGGAWDKLQAAILPDWKSGLGLSYSDVKFDTQHNEFIWIQNQYGGWSMAVLISAPNASQLRERIRGYEPSFVFVDELTSCNSPEYFQAVAAQIGRRPFVDGMQQYVAACNPEGPSHWVYQKWFVQAFNEETGDWDPDFEAIYFPVAENECNLTPGYLSSLKKIYRDDKTEAARMIEGTWIDRPSGEGLFRDLYNPIIHVRPLDEDSVPSKHDRLSPDKNHPIIIGLDPGSVYNSFIFEQWLPLDEKMKWLVFDEVVVTKMRVPYEILVPAVMKRVAFWRSEVGGTASTMPQIWISDDSAFNQYRAAQGSYDVLEIERIYEENRAKFGLEPMKVRSAPKFNGSTITRVRLIQKMLGSDEIVISSGCPMMMQMFLKLEGKKTKPGETPDPEGAMTPQRSDVVHIFDAFSYPVLASSLNPTALSPRSDSSQRLISAA